MAGLDLKRWKSPAIEAGCLALLFSLCSLWFLPLLSGKLAWFDQDFLPQVIPYFEWLHRSLASGQTPFWCGDILLGVPAHDQGIAAVFYPPLRGLLTFFNARTALVLHMLGHFFLAGAGAYALARSLGLHPATALFCGVVTALGGGMAYSLHFWANVVSLAWLPWQFLGLELLLRGGQEGARLHRRAVGGVLLLGFATGMSVNGGHLALTFYGLLALALRLWLAPWRRYKHGPGLWPLARRLAGASALALLLCGGQLLATSRYLGQSVRAEAFSYEQAAENSLSPASLLSPALPLAWGSTEDNSFLGMGWKYGSWTHQGLLLYAGLAALLFFFAGLKAKPERAKPYAWALGLLTLYSLGNYFPLHGWLQGLPVFEHLRGPMKAASLSPLLFAIPAGFGLQALAEGHLGWKKPLGWALTGASLFFAVWGGLKVASPSLDKAGASYIERKIASSPLHSHPKAYYVEKLARWKARLGRHGLEQTFFALALAALLALSALPWLRAHAWILSLLAAALAAAELSRYGMGHYPLIDSALYTKAPPAVDAIKAREKRGLGSFRILGWGWSQALAKAYPKGNHPRRLEAEQRLAATMGNNFSLSFGLDNLRGYSAVPLARSEAVLDGANDFQPGLKLGEQTRKLLSRRRLLDLAGVKYFISEPELEAPGFTRLKSGPPALYLNERARPLAWFARGVRQAGSAAEALENAAAQPSDSGVVWVEEEDQARSGLAQGRVEFKEKKDHLWRLKLSAPEGGFLFLSRAHYQGPWTAMVDGRPARLMAADGAFSGLWVPEGARELVLEYKDPLHPWALAAFLTGLAVALLSALALPGIRDPEA